MEDVNINEILTERCRNKYSHPLLISASQSIVYEVFDLKSQKPVILKLTRNPGTAASEELFLKSWKKQGVKVPEILYSDTNESDNEYEILVMEKISGSRLDYCKNINEILIDKIAFNQSLMHQCFGEGFGRPNRVDPKYGVNNTFSEEMELEWERRIINIIDHNIFPDDLRSIFLKATKYLESDLVKKKLKASLTHSDLSDTNIILNDKNEIIIIDPNCRITHPAMCAAFTYLNIILNRGDQMGLLYKKLFLDYSGVGEEAFYYALQLRSILSITTWLRKGKLHQSLQAIKVANL